MPGHIGDDRPGDGPAAANREVMDVAAALVPLVRLATDPPVQAGHGQRLLNGLTPAADLHAMHGPAFGRFVCRTHASLRVNQYAHAMKTP